MIRAIVQRPALCFRSISPGPYYVACTPLVRCDDFSTISVIVVEQLWVRCTSQATISAVIPEEVLRPGILIGSGASHAYNGTWWTLALRLPEGSASCDTTPNTQRPGVYDD